MKRVVFTRSSLLAAAATITSFSSAWAADIAVPGDQPTLQAAVAAAEEDDRIILADGTYTWTGRRNFLKLDPAVGPGHIFVIEPRGSAA